ncbi:MAG: GNAT family N-acetyltransferase [Chitinophagaceae bacterium]
MKITSTERLELRRFTLDDVTFIVQLLNSSGWLQFIGDRGVRTTKDAEAYLEGGPIKSYAVNGFGLWLTALKESSTPIGMCGMLKREGLDEIELGFALLPEYIRRGYAYEMAQATVEYAKTTFSLLRIAAITKVDNNASIRLLNNLNFKFERTVNLHGSEQMLNLYAADLR